MKNHLKFFAMKNNAGKYTTPGLRGITAACNDREVGPANGECTS